MQDLDFISGKFFETEIPKDKRYLLKYFKTDLQEAFLKYYLVFGSVKNFVDHTGHYCDSRTVYKMQRKYRQITLAHAEARSKLTEENMEILQLIESGKYIINPSTKEGTK